ncbi:hypothetical protein CBL_20847 [Carabus blaptoides fortunei]
MRKRAALITRLRIRLRGCSERVQLLTYTMFVRPLADFRAVCYASARTNLITPILPMERRFLRKFKGLNWQHPSRDVHQSAGIPPITDRMHQLQARYTRRRIDQINNTSHGLDITVSRFRNPCYKYPHPPAILLGRLDQLPDNLQQILDATPLSYRH